VKTDLFEKIKSHPIITTFIVIAAIGAFLADWKTVLSSQAPPSVIGPSPPPVAASQSPPLPPVVPTTMTPEAITEELGKMAPMMRQGFAAQFIGVPFDWTLQLSKAEADKEHIRVALNPKPGWPLVFGKLPLERTADLKTVPSGEKVRIKGTIESVDSTVSISVNISEFTILRQ
jgi:hypothetical protein